MTIPNISKWIGQPVRAKEFEKCLWQSLAKNIFLNFDGMASDIVVA